MDSTVFAARKRFYRNTVAAIDQRHRTPEDLCLVFVQHAFLPTLDFLASIDTRVAALVPKESSAKSNPDVVSDLKEKFTNRVYAEVNRLALADESFAITWLRRVTRGRPFAILEYGGYFAPVASAISSDPVLGKKLVGFVEGTENGIKGSDDGRTPGYEQVVEHLNHPVISKSRSRIKSIMDMEIGSAIVYATDSIFRTVLGCSLKYCQGSVGVIGLGVIGTGVLQALVKDNCQPCVYDTDLSVMAELALRQHQIVSRQQVLQQSDVLFLNTGSCFLSRQPELLSLIRDNAILVLCTSGDVEAGIPQLVADGNLQIQPGESSGEIAVFTTCYGKRIRVLLASDGVGQAPNMAMRDGSSSPANLMSDMEFYALGKYLGDSGCDLQPGEIHSSPDDLDEIILEQWLREFYPACVMTDKGPAYSDDLQQRSLSTHTGDERATDEKKALSAAIEEI